MSSNNGGASRSIRRHVLTAMTVGILVVSGLGGWAMTTELSGAVVASGLLVVDSNVKKVQHPTGGVVGELRVRDGVHVRAGDLLIRLDETITRANLANVDVRRVVEGEQKLFDLRKSARAGQKAQLKERIGQIKEEIGGLTVQVEAKQNEISLILKELEGVRYLWQQSLVPITRLTQLERESVRIGGERGQLMASMAQARGKMTETELQIIQIDQDLRSEVAKELREIQGKMAELVERRVAAEDQLMRTEIRAPQTGVVHQLMVHTIGGVITASEPAMLIVPESDDLTVEVKLPPQHIDQLSLGQPAVLRFSAFNQRTTPEINGTVVRISGDIILDQKSGATFYLVHISTPPEEIARLEGLRLIPGMPVEAFIQTDARTVLSYLVKPMRDQI